MNGRILAAGALLAIGGCVLAGGSPRARSRSVAGAATTVDRVTAMRLAKLEWVRHECAGGGCSLTEDDFDVDAVVVERTRYLVDISLKGTTLGGGGRVEVLKTGGAKVILLYQ